MLSSYQKLFTFLVILGTGFNRLAPLIVAQETGEIGTSFPPTDPESVSIIEPEEEEQDSSQDGEAKRFDYKLHPDDHGVYAGRSLSSTRNIKSSDNSLNDDTDMDGFAESIKADKVRSKKIENEEEKYDDDEELPLKTVDYAEKEWQLMFRALDLSYSTESSPVLQEILKHPIMEQVLSRLPAACQRDLNHIKNSFKKHRLWALRMIDSMGKIPSGMTYGRFASAGDFEECLKVRVDELVETGHSKNKSDQYERFKFHGKYCLLDFRLPLPEKPHNKLLSIHDSVLNFTGTELERLYPEFVHNYSVYASVFYEVGYTHAFCLPSSCRVHDLTKSLSKSLEGMFLIVNNTIDCEEWPEEGEPWRKSQIISMFLLIVVFSNALVASFVHYLLPKGNKAATTSPATTKDNKGQPSFKEKLVNLSVRCSFYSECFSIQRNFERLSKPDPRGLTFVHYTRIVAMALTVITHTGALGTLQAITKPADSSNSEQIFRDFIPQMLANAFTSIQIFFFMAGFMLVVSTYPSVKREKGRLSLLEYAIKRAIRLMPGIAATICINFLWPLAVEGPMMKYFIRMIVIPCEDNWWHTLGFVSNFDHVEKMCLRHSYFSASDYQLHIMAFPLLILLYKHPTVALCFAGLLTLSGFVAQVIMILTKKVVPFMMVDYIDKDAFFNVIHYVHHPVWNHMSAFFYGFFVGYFVVKQIRIGLSDTATKRIWYTLIPIGILSIFAPYYWNHYKRPIYRWQMVLYVLIDRFVLLTTCAWLSYASMVLARPPARSKRPEVANNEAKTISADGGKTDCATEKQQPTPIPLPIIVQAPPPEEEPSHRIKPQTHSAIFETGYPNSQVSPSLMASDENHDRFSQVSLVPNLPAAGLLRQRSSPNIAQLQNDQSSQQLQQQPRTLPTMLNLRRMHRTTSGGNLATISETSTRQGEQDKTKSTVSMHEETSEQRNGKSLKAANNKTEAASKRTNGAPVSNMNALCLILSRLTFQLYLFNMVVLWIDVNQSKYYWYFSYYFIIIKAAAVYIVSALLAMIFFVVLESPSLTLYIAWVRGRAASRARKMSTNISLSDTNSSNKKLANETLTNEKK